MGRYDSLYSTPTAGGVVTTLFECQAQGLFMCLGDFYGRRLQEHPEGVNADGRANREVEQAQEADDDGQDFMTFFLDVTLFIRLDALYHYSFRRE